MADIDLKSDFIDEQSGYDINDYTQGNFDGMIGSGENTPDKGAKKKLLKDVDRIENANDIDAATCSDMQSYLSNEEDGEEGYYDQQPIYDPQTNSQDIRKFMKNEKE